MPLVDLVIICYYYLFNYYYYIAMFVSLVFSSLLIVYNKFWHSKRRCLPKTFLRSRRLLASMMGLLSYR